MDDNEIKSETAVLQARVDEIAEALALTNEKFDLVIAKVAQGSALDSVQLPTFNKDDKLWQLLRLKPIAKMTREEIQELNEKVAERQFGKRVFSRDSVKAPSPQESYTVGMEAKDNGISGAMLGLVKNLIFSEVHGTRRMPDEELTEHDLKEFLLLGM